MGGRGRRRVWEYLCGPSQINTKNSAYVRGGVARAAEVEDALDVADLDGGDDEAAGEEALADDVDGHFGDAAVAVVAVPKRSVAEIQRRKRQTHMSKPA